MDEATKLNAAAFVQTIETKRVCETLHTIWANVYAETPDRIIFNERSQFQSNFMEKAELHDAD